MIRTGNIGIILISVKFPKVQPDCWPMNAKASVGQYDLNMTRVSSKRVSGGESQTMR
jgi:hypothetical protein